jgi:hypothetical protein
MRAPDRKAMIDPGKNDLSVRRQCALLDLSRPGVSAGPSPSQGRTIWL